MTTNSREHQKSSEKPLLELTEPVGTPVDKETFDRIASVVDSVHSEDDGLSYWLRDSEDGRDESKLATAWGMNSQVIWALQHDGAFFVTVGARKKSSDAEEDETVVREVYSGYENAGAAVQDARRLIVRAALKEKELRGVLGWRKDAVLLLKADLWLIIRTYRDGRIVIEYDEEPNSAYDGYTEACMKLAREMEYEMPEGLAGAEGWMMAPLIAAFIRREAAQMMLQQAKLSLGIRLQGMRKLQQETAVKKINYTGLARDLYTDLGALNRAEKFNPIPDAEWPTNRP